MTALLLRLYHLLPHLPIVHSNFRTAILGRSAILIRQLLHHDKDKDKEKENGRDKYRLLLVDNIPKIGPDKVGKLLPRLTHVFDKVGRLERDPNKNTPLLSIIRVDGGDDHAVCYAFAEFITLFTPEEVIKVMKSFHNFQLDDYSKRYP